MMNDTFMKEKPVLPLILSMTLPMVLSMLVNSLYNIVDSYFVAKVSEDAMTALIMTFAIMLLGLILSWSVPAALIGIFTANPATITIGVHAMHIISLGFIVSAVSVTCCGALEGLGAGMPSLMISLLRYLIIMIPAALLLCRPFLSDGVWIAFPVTEVMTAVIAWAIYHRQTKHMFASSN